MSLALLPSVPTSRETPHATAAEQSVLGGILIKPSMLAEVATLLAVDDFFLPAHREIFEAMLALDKRRRPVEIISLSDELKARGMLSRLEGGEAYLETLGNAATIGEVAATHARIVADKALLRKVIATCAEIGSAAYGDADSGELLESLGAKCSQLARGASSDLVAASDRMPAIIDVLEKREKAGKSVTGVPTGVSLLDRFTGGFQPANLVVIAARPGVGKTAFAAQTAAKLAMNGGTALLLSLEMSTDEILERQIANLAKIDSEALRQGRIKNDWDAIHRAARDLCSASLYVDDRSYTYREMAGQARRWRARHPVQRALLVVDYLQLVESTERGQSRERAVADISRGLKRLSKELACPVIAVSQLNRKCEDENREPRLSDLRESGAVEQDSDVVIFPYNPKKAEEGEIELILAKNRNGRTGKFSAHWTGKHYMVSDIAKGMQDGPTENWFDAE